MSNSAIKRVTSVVSASALTLAALVGVSSPANAAAGLTIEVAEGSGFTFVSKSEPVFNVAGNADFIASNGTQLRVQLTNMGAAGEHVLTDVSINGTVLDADYTAGTGNSIALIGTAATGDLTPTSSNATVANLVNSRSGTKSVFGLGDADTTFNGTNSPSVMTAPFTFTLDDNSDLADGETSVYLMTAFADADNDGVVDAGEIQTSQTITFISPDDVTTTVTSAKPLAGAANFEVDLTANVNLAYVPSGESGKFGIYVKEGSTEVLAGDFDAGILNSSSSSVTLDSDTKAKFDITVAPTAISTSTGSGASFTIQGVFDGDGNNPTDSDADLRGTAITVFTGAVSVSGDQSVATVVRSANAKATTTDLTANMGADVRKNSDLRVMADFENSSGENLVGKSVTWTASASPVLSASKTVTLAGTVYDSDADLGVAAIAATTNASGRVFLDVDTSGFAAEDTLTLTATADGVAEVVVLTAKTAAYTAEFVDGTIASNTGYGKTILAGGSHAVSIAVADQWGVAPANGVQNVSLSRATNASRTTAANWTYTLPVVDGFATGTIVDNGTGAGSDTVTATLSGTGGSGSDTMTLTYSTAAAATVSTVELTDNQGTGDSTIRLDADSLPAWHYHLTAAADEPEADTANFVDGATTGTSDTLLAISGTAKNAAGVGVAGKEVTLSASGITFEFTDAANNEIYSRDSITVPTTSGGAFSVNAYSDGKGGSTVITASVDGASDTTTVTFVAGTATGMDLDVPATAAQGRAVDIIATLTDVAGDPVSGVSVSFKATGVGYLSNLSGTTDAAGEVVVKLITQNGETGDATITATATLDGVSTAVAKTVTVGQTAEETEQKVNAGSFKGYVAVYAKGYEGDRLSFKAGNDWNVTESLASDYERVVEFTGAGYTIDVPIYINRVLVDTISVTTK